jgi:hypothetical protein
MQEGIRLPIETQYRDNNRISQMVNNLTLHKEDHRLLLKQDNRSLMQEGIRLPIEIL